MTALTILAACFLIGAAFFVGYIAGRLDERDRQTSIYRIRARLLDELPEWAKRPTTETGSEK